MVVTYLVLALLLVVRDPTDSSGTLGHSHIVLIGSDFLMSVFLSRLLLFGGFLSAQFGILVLLTLFLLLIPSKIHCRFDEVLA